MLIDEDVVVKWNNRNRKHYEDLGYSFSKNGDQFTVKTRHLTKGSHSVVKVLCDYCTLVIVEKTFKTYIQQNEKSIIKKDCCKECKSIKTKESNLIVYGVPNVMHVEEHRESQENALIEKYGVSNVSYIPEIIEKRKLTTYKNFGVEHYFQVPGFSDMMREKNLKKYGVDWYTKTQEYANRVREFSIENYGIEHFASSKEHQGKIRNSVQEKYGVDNVFQSEEVKEKIKEFNLMHYGVSHYSQTEQFAVDTSNTWAQKTEDEIQEIVEKRQETSMMNYGVKSPMQSPIVKSKAMQTMHSRGTAPTSKQQLHIAYLINGELNYPVGSSFLDIALINDKIFIEYDGGGHDLAVKHGDITSEELTAKDRRRSFNLFDKGWKEIRLVSSKDKLPKDPEILKTIEKSRSFLMERKNKSIIINWDDRTVLVSYKMQFSLDEFLNDDFKFVWEVA